MSPQAAVRRKIGLSTLFCVVVAIVCVVEIIDGSSFARALSIGLFCGVGSAAGGAIVNTVKGRRGD